MHNPKDVAIIMCFLSHITGTISLGDFCPKQNLCKCKYSGQNLDLFCLGKGDLIDLKLCLTEKFSNVSIRNLFLKKCTATSLPSGFIQNVTLRMLYMKCPLASFSVDAFLGSYSWFSQLRIHHHKLNVIPDAFSFTSNLRRLWIQNGDLKIVGRQLKHLKKLEILSLRRNRIEHISRRAFITMTSLYKIYLSDNLIKLIHPNAFASCRKISDFFLNNNRLETAEGLFDFMNPKVIHLHHNNLTDIHIFHRRMHRVIEINLSFNPLGRITSSAFGQNVSNVLSLSLANTSLTDVAENALSSFTLLQNLDLSANQLEFIYTETFDNLISLQTLDLSRNKLPSIKGIFIEYTKLKTLSLSGNKLTELKDSLFGLSTIRELSLDKNKLYALTDENFMSTNINLFSARRNNISTLTKNCFKHLINIIEIDLTGNSIVSLNGSIQNFSKMENLFVPFNRIEKLEDDDLANLPRLTRINFQANKLRSLNEQFKYLNNLVYVNLKANCILRLDRKVFPNIILMKKLLLAENPLVCNCQLKWLKKLESQRPGLLNGPRCQRPEWLRGRRFEDTSNSDLEVWKGRCPLPCNCVCVSKERELRISVNCTHRNLTNMPKQFPIYMVRLDISHNNLSTFGNPPTNFSAFDHLEKLNMENNQIISVKNLISLKRLSVLMMAKNKLRTLAVEDRMNYTSVTLSGNPWLCDCSTLQFREWLLTFKDKIKDINKTFCGKGNVKSELRHIPIIHLSESQICPLKTALYIFVSMGMLGSLLIISSSAVTYYRYGLNIKIWLYSRGFTWVKEDDIDRDKKFDAFVSYSYLDEKFVHNILRPKLEYGSPAFQLCIHERNFPIGNDIEASILAAVRYSRRTVIVLSKNFLRSEWCILEFRTAHLQALEDKVNRVIIILFGEMPPENEIEDQLRVYLKSTTYLVWGEKYFWQKLHYALPKVREKRELEPLRYDEKAHLLTGYY